MACAPALYALHFLRKVIIISRLHLSALWAGFVCQLQTSLRELFLAFRDLLIILSKQEGLKLKSWWRSDARQCLCESVSHLLRQCTRASVGIVSAVERIGNNAIRSRLGGSMGGTGQHCVTPSMVTESQAEAKVGEIFFVFEGVAADLEFVATVATVSCVKFLSAV